MVGSIATSSQIVLLCMFTRVLSHLTPVLQLKIVEPKSSKEAVLLTLIPIEVLLIFTLLMITGKRTFSIWIPMPELAVLLIVQFLITKYLVVIFAIYKPTGDPSISIWGSFLVPSSTNGSAWVPVPFQPYAALAAISSASLLILMTSPGPGYPVGTAFTKRTTFDNESELMNAITSAKTDNLIDALI
ncbi:MAG: hypothetical protein QW520_08755 [Methanomassiliicoccales archaeon]